MGKERRGREGGGRGRKGSKGRGKKGVKEGEVEGAGVYIAYSSTFSLAYVSWWRGTVVERRSLAGELSLSCARPADDG